MGCLGTTVLAIGQKTLWRRALLLFIWTSTLANQSLRSISGSRVEASWQLPAVLRYGSWNDCPEAEVHWRVHREWQDAYGAEIASIPGDVVECIVEHPPIDRTTAVILARQQYAYCGDIVIKVAEASPPLLQYSSNPGFGSSGGTNLS